MALAKDGTPASGYASGANTVVSGTFTTSLTNDVIVALVAGENYPNGTITVSSVTASGLTFSLRKRYQFTAPGGSDNGTLEVWYAIASSTFSGTVTATWASSATPENSSISVFAVNGANTSSPWDTNSSLPATASNTGSAIPSISGISTTATNTMLLGFVAAQNTSPPSTQTAGSGYTILWNGSSGGTADELSSFNADEYQIVSSAQSSVTVAFGTSWTAWGMIVDAIVAASGGSSLAASPGTFTTTGEPAAFSVQTAASPGTFTLTGEADTFSTALSASPGTFTLTGAATFGPASPGAFTLTGEPAVFGTTLAGGVGTFTLTGDNGTFGVVLENAQGTFTLTGDAASFTNGGNVTLGASPGTFTLSGDASTFSLGLAAADGVFTLTGDVGAFGLILETVPGTFSLTGEPTGFNAAIGTTPGTFSVTGSSVTFFPAPSTTKATKPTTISSLTGYAKGQFPVISQNLNVFLNNEFQKIQTSMRSTQQIQSAGQMGVTPNTGVPTTSDLPPGGAGLFKDTSGGGVYLAYNDNGTIKKATLS